MVVEESSASKEEESGQTNYNYVESFRERQGMVIDPSSG